MQLNMLLKINGVLSVGNSFFFLFQKEKLLQNNLTIYYYYYYLSFFTLILFLWKCMYTLQIKRINAYKIYGSITVFNLIRWSQIVFYYLICCSSFICIYDWMSMEDVNSNMMFPCLKLKNYLFKFLSNNLK